MKQGEVVWFVVSGVDYPTQEVRTGAFRGYERYGDDHIQLAVVEDSTTGEWWRVEPSRVFTQFDQATAFAQVVANVANDCFNAKKEGSAA